MVEGEVDAFVNQARVDRTESFGYLYDDAANAIAPNLDVAPPVSSDTVLLLHCDSESDGKTPDASPSGHTVELKNGAQISTAEKKFGSASLRLTGVADDAYAFAPSSDDWDLFVKEFFTIDLWVRHDVYAPTDAYDLEAYLLRATPGSGGTAWALRTATRATPGNAGLQFWVNGPSGAPWIMQLGGQVMDPDWHHVAVVKDGNHYGCYFDGRLVIHQESDVVIPTTGDLYIGRTGEPDDWLVGNMDEIRIVHGNPFGAHPLASGLNQIGLIVPDQAYGGADPVMSLVARRFRAAASPASVRLVLEVENRGNLAPNAGLRADASRDGGTTWAPVTLIDHDEYETGRSILAGDADVSGTPSGRRVHYRIQVMEPGAVRLHGAAVSWG